MNWNPGLTTIWCGLLVCGVACNNGTKNSDTGRTGKGPADAAGRDDGGIETDGGSGAEAVETDGGLNAKQGSDQEAPAGSTPAPGASPDAGAPADIEELVTGKGMNTPADGGAAEPSAPGDAGAAPMSATPTDQDSGALPDTGAPPIETPPQPTGRYDVCSNEVGDANPLAVQPVLSDVGRAPGVANVGQPADGLIWVEALGRFLFSDRVNPGRILQWDPQEPAASVFSDSGGGEGMTITAGGEVIVVDDVTSEIRSFDPLAEPFMTTSIAVNVPAGSRGLNDVTVRSDGNLYYTDNGDSLYHLPPGGEVLVLESPFDGANGVLLSEDEGTLFVTSTAVRRLWEFTLATDGSVQLDSARELAVTEGVSTNGFTRDCAGNFYIASSLGAEVFSETGMALGVIATPARATSLAFGGPEHSLLLIATGSGLHAAQMPIPGLAD